MRHLEPSLHRTLTVFVALLLLALSSPALADPGDAIDRACVQESVPFCTSLDFERTAVTDDVALYRFELQVGPGPHDRIALYRVVAESAPFVPAHAQRAVLLAHGDRWGFLATYLASLETDTVADEHALPIFLAQNGLDVWGMDFRWALVPGTVTDTTFMGPWGLDTDADDLRLALAVAREVRLDTGSGYARLAVAGFSRGAQTAYLLAAEESSLPPGRRHAKALIPIDMTVAFDDADLSARACARHAEMQSRLDNGQTSLSTTFLAFLADLALVLPDDASPFFSVFTNRQLMLDLVGFPSPNGLVPGFHAAGVEYDGFFPQAALHSDETLIFQSIRGQAVHQPVRVLLDGEALLCDQVDSPLDDDLAHIDLPVFYLGAGGGVGPFGIHATTLLASTDITTLVVSVDEDQGRDLGHQDLFWADDAPSLVWQPLLDWLRALP